MAIISLDLTPTERSHQSAFYRPELDILRFFAFLGVFIRHITLNPTQYSIDRHIPAWCIRWEMIISAAGSYGVDLFFVLSAYLITELLFREKSKTGRLDVRSFYMRRILRIWPLYFTFIAVAALVPFCNPQHQFTARYIIPYVLLLGNWSMVVYGWPESVAVPLWSISVEEQFYLFWPPIVARLTRHGVLVAAILMILLANLSRLCVLLLHGSASQLWGNTFAHLDSIAAGILIAVLLKGCPPAIPRWMRYGMIVTAVAAMCARAYFSVLLPRDTLGWGDTLVGWPVVAGSCATIVVAFIGLPVRVAYLRYPGKISYGLYVFHMLCIRIADRLLREESGVLHFTARIGLSFALTVLMAALSYNFLERPFLKLKDRFAHVSSRPV
ncbi:MAG: acyltransferase [Acidobacteriaceae bacterium]